MPWQNGLDESEIKYDQTQTPSFRNWYYKLHKNNNKDVFITENFANTRGKMQMKCCNFLENNATY